MNYLQNVKIKNFRSLGEFELKDLKQFNVIVGNNNVGKTSILEAIFIGMFPGNPGIPANVNLTRNIDVIDNDFWLSLFHQFHAHNTFVYEGTFIDGTKWTFALTPNFASYQDISFTNGDKTHAARPLDTLSSEVEKNIVGLTATFSTVSKEGTQQAYTSTVTMNQSERLDFTPDEKYKAEEKGYFLNAKSMYENNSVSQRFGSISKRKKEGEIVKVLQKIEPNIEDIDLDNKNRIRLSDRRFDQKVSLNTYGDGFFRFTHIILSIYDAQQGMVFIDELENGLDRNNQKNLWDIIFTTAKEYKTQLFITTHSDEMITNFYNMAIKTESTNDIGFIRIEYHNGKHEARELSFDQLKLGLEENVEIR